MERDYNKYPRETITLPMVFIFLGFILLLIVGGLFYLRYSSWSPFADIFKKKLPNSLAITELVKKNTPSSSLTTEVKITEDQLSQSAGVANPDFPLRKATLEIKPEGILVAGKTANGFWGLPVSVLFLPVVDQGKLSFEIKEIKAGGVVAPPKVVETLTPKMKGIFASSFSGLGSVTIVSARTLVKYMILETKL